METKRGHPAAGFRLPEITGRWQQLADYSGHWLLLCFTGTWPDCRAGNTCRSCDGTRGS